MVDVDTVKYRIATDVRSVRKNVSMPAIWAISLIFLAQADMNTPMTEIMRSNLTRHTDTAYNVSVRE